LPGFFLKFTGKLMNTVKKSSIYFSAILLLVFSGLGVAADKPDNEIATIPPEKLPGAQKEVANFDDGRKCKRIRKTGSNRITRVCTTSAERDARSAESNEFLREQQIRQERGIIENADTGIAPRQ
jgi:hypothetical protein